MKKVVYVNIRDYTEPNVVERIIVDKHLKFFDLVIINYTRQYRVYLNNEDILKVIQRFKFTNMAQVSLVQSLKAAGSFSPEIELAMKLL